MSKWKVPVQSLIDHIKTATDVDPWAKDMVETLLEPIEPIRAERITRDIDKGVFLYVCGACNAYVDYHDRYCKHCGCEIRWE